MGGSFTETKDSGFLALEVPGFAKRLDLAVVSWQKTGFVA